MESPLDSEFLPINIELLRASCPFSFDLFIKVNDKYIHYIKNGDDIDESRLEKFKKIEKLKEKAVDRLFIPKADHDAFNDFVAQELEDVANDEEMEVEDKMKIIQDLAINTVECIFAEPESQQAYELTLKAAKGLRKVVNENPKSLKKIFARKGRNTDKIELHCTNTAAIALKVAFASGFRGTDLDNLGAAALLHDIGLKNLKQDELDIIFARPRTRLKPNDKLIYGAHVKDGALLLSKKDFVNPEIIKLVENHEEDLGGTGYPNKLTALDPLQQILNLCNRFDKKVSIEGLEPVKAYNEIYKDEIGKIDLKYFDKLKDVIKASEMNGDD